MRLYPLTVAAVRTHRTRCGERPCTPERRESLLLSLRKRVLFQTTAVESGVGAAEARPPLCEPLSACPPRSKPLHLRQTVFQHRLPGVAEPCVRHSVWTGAWRPWPPSTPLAAVEASHLSVCNIPHRAARQWRARGRRRIGADPLLPPRPQSALRPFTSVFNVTVSVLQGSWVQGRHCIKLCCYLRCNKAVCHEGLGCGCSFGSDGGAFPCPPLPSGLRDLRLPCPLFPSESRKAVLRPQTGPSGQHGPHGPVCCSRDRPPLQLRRVGLDLSKEK